MEEVVIVGAGIAGLATAVALKRVGIKALVLERWDGLRATGAALSLLPNAWRALDALGVSHKLTIYSPPKKSYVTNLETGAIQEVPFGGTNAGGHQSGPKSVHRKALLEALGEELQADSIRFSSKINGIGSITHEGSSIAVLYMEDGSIIKAKVLIGCDGVHSAVATWLGLASPVDAGRTVVRGLAVFPQGHGLKHELQQFVGSGTRSGFLPVTDRDIFWFYGCSTPPKGADHVARDPKLIQREIIENYAKDFPELYLDIVKHSDLSTVHWAQLVYRQPWNVAFGNLSNQNVTVAGDAMHPMTPDLAQGGCSALEDAVVLGRHIGTSFIKNGGLVPSEVPKVLANYVEERRWRAVLLIIGSYFSGWVQQGGSSWAVKFFRDSIFYRFLFRMLASVTQYDCGKLPTI
ncbi:3-hydroxybenzoate 6-hydroxylase 1 [Morus notabilis]|uniref:3-hydroxybenzoate 6-hydroxylase 1 n=1 Tax=Morus notabilis TaxID=981085 RepID=W9QGC3_9ROSA|nr:monooxygenase 2 [Morus notabilis]EXB36912.1 3-hydroxybenzoate 6-hydroxylase 1 [Morus notabilis]